MENNHIKDKLSEYIDGSLNEQEHDKIARHLTTCDECSANHSDLLKITAALNDLPIKKLPDDAEKRLLSRLGLDATKRRLPLFKFATSPLTAVAAVFVIVVYATLFTAGAPDTTVMMDKSKMEKSLAPPAELDAGSAVQGDREGMILADISDVSEESSILKEAPSKSLKSIEAAPQGSADSLNQKLKSSPIIVITTSRTYGEDDLPELLNTDTSSFLDENKETKRLLEKDWSKETSLNNALGVIGNRYPASVPIYAEKASFAGQAAWLIIISHDGFRRLIVVKASE